LDNLLGTSVAETTGNRALIIHILVAIDVLTSFRQCTALGARKENELLVIVYVRLRTAIRIFCNPVTFFIRATFVFKIGIIEALNGVASSRRGGYGSLSGRTESVRRCHCGCAGRRRARTTQATATRAIGLKFNTGP